MSGTAVRDPAARERRRTTRTGWTAAPLAPLMLLAGACTAFVAARPLRDNSFLTHLATGRLILGSGVPETNPFLYTGTDFPIPSWWWSILLGVADQVGGAGAIRLLTAAVAGVLGALLIALAAPDASRTPSRLVPVAAPAGLALVCVFVYLNPRPHLVGFVLLAAMLLVWRDERSPWWIAGLFVVWVNVHGSWVYGLAVLVLFSIARAVDDRRIRPGDVHQVLAACGGLLVGGALYPERLQLLGLPLRTFGDSTEREAITTYSEWGRLSFGEPVLWALFALAACALVGALRSGRRGAAVLSVLMLLLGASGARMVPIAAISLVGLASTGLAGVGSLRIPTGRAAVAVRAVGISMLGLTLLFALATPGYALAPYPVAAIDWLEERDLVANGTHVVSHDYVGNYLEWRYGERAGAYVDDRPDAATLLDYVSLMRVEEGWRDALGRASPDVVLWNTERPLVDELDADPDWVRAVDLERHAVFCRAAIADRCS